MLPEDFIAYLRDHVKGFSAETERHQWHLAWMAWQGSQKRRQHRSEPGAMSFSQAELDRAFGRGKFESLRHRTGFFFRLPRWSHEHKITRAYFLGPHIYPAIRAYKSRTESNSTRVMSLSGNKIKVVRSLPAAISSTGTNGRATKTDKWKRAKGLNRIPVNVEMLGRLRDSARSILRDRTALEDGTPLDRDARRTIGRIMDTSDKILRMARMDLAGPRHIPQVYAIAPAGRLYARGLNLQNAPRQVKEAALHGMWEYDFANCHFSIVSQMANKFRLACPSIEHYLANKSLIRQEVAKGAGIEQDKAKHCLLALLYGARPSGRATDAFPAMIGVDAAKLLYVQPAFVSLRQEIERVRSVILDGWPRTRNGSLTNDCGKAIGGSEPRAAQFAHLVQGVEARALMAIVNTHAEKIVLLQHDGFAARERLDSKALERAVFDQVGYMLKLEERELKCDPDVRQLLDRIESEMALEAAPDIGFDSVSAD
ncbi:hypothetical protein [Rhodoferax sediminis]|uniref:Uncharacterized protein n=1 Tax=Rhodoferax sediminis TaxID=2509614 RepID=A0A515D6B3_9BURK|nr:hypothetical protein [Rhodoferax sediminis]QDL35956.1 hypothetical protein EUB48_00600 [Rhodoferax sediminis]